MDDVILVHGIFKVQSDIALEVWLSIFYIFHTTYISVELAHLEIFVLSWERCYKFGELHNIEIATTESTQTFKPEGVLLCLFFYFTCSWWGERRGLNYPYKRWVLLSRSSTALQRNGVLLEWRWWPNIECLLSTFVIFRPVLLCNLIYCDFSAGGVDLDPLSPIWIL